MLALDVEWLMDVCWATTSPADARPEWPVQPDRVFSALAASWGAHGQPAVERRALEWLEALPPPRLYHARAAPRTTVTTFVPPNDDASLNPRVVPALRRRQPRQFPASVLPRVQGGAHLRLIWHGARPDAAALRALEALARDTSYVGHSASVVRCRFHETGEEPSDLAEGTTCAAPYAGRLADLNTAFDAHLGGAEKSRPTRATLPTPLRPAPPPVPCSVFGPNWIVLAHAGGRRPDLRAGAAIARKLRRALMERHPDPLPEWLSGHAENGAPTRAPHLAIVPLGHVAGPYADGTLMGMAIILPRTLDAVWQEAATPDSYAERTRFDGALAALRQLPDETGTPAIGLRWDEGAPWLLRRMAMPDAFNLRPQTYAHTARRWATVTPIALDRFPDDARIDRSAEAMATVAATCVNIGLPPPKEVRLHKHTAFPGAPSAWPPGGAPAWLGWARPGTLAHRKLIHATLTFAEPVAGPVILGAGRFVGLGLCRPVA